MSFCHKDCQLRRQPPIIGRRGAILSTCWECQLQNGLTGEPTFGGRLSDLYDIDELDALEVLASYDVDSLKKTGAIADLLGVPIL
jgi:hypothetical protein